MRDLMYTASERIEVLKRMTDVQCEHGNWNYDPYMHGMANAMIYSVAIMCNSEPEYLTAPETWLRDVEGPTEGPNEASCEEREGDYRGISNEWINILFGEDL